MIPTPRAVQLRLILLSGVSSRRQLKRGMRAWWREFRALLTGRVSESLLAIRWLTVIERTAKTMHPT
jgi:uncharacterized membrane protein